MNKSAKKFISLLLVLVICFTSVSAFASDVVESASENCDVYIEITTINDVGDFVTYTVKEGETIPLYGQEEGSGSRSYTHLATLYVGRISDSTVYFQFTSTLVGMLVNVGFSGEVSITDRFGFSGGTYYYLLPTFFSSMPGTARCNMIISGNFLAVGYGAIPIFYSFIIQ
jgi:hypothetical protein